MRDIHLLVIHHSASPLTTTAHDIYEWHTAKGYIDIGYQGVIEGDGSYAPGRDITTVGAHARSANKHSLGICVVGDNTKPGSEWSSVQIATLRQVLTVWLWMWPSAKIAGHRDVGSTTTLCPGLDVRALFPEFPAVSPRGEA